MSTSNIVSNLTAGNNQAAQAGILKAGVPVQNNAGPSLTANPASSPMTSTLVDPSTNPFMPTPLSTGTPIAAPTTAAVPTPSPIAGSNPGNVTKQLTDTFGKGTGSLLDSEINNLGSGDSSYMQAYKAAMAPANAENLATLNTTLGNGGVSANSSTEAIADADFQSNVTSQEGLQEQQLQMNDLSQLLGLTESIENPSVAEVSSGGFLNDFGKIATDVSALIPGAPGMPSMGGGGGSSSYTNPTDDFSFEF